MMDFSKFLLKNRYKGSMKGFFHARLVRNFVQKYINQKTQVYIRSFSILLGKLVLTEYTAENARS